MVEDNTRQHIIPQAYLKWFAQKNKKGNYYVKVTLKSNDKTFTKSIREVGYKRNYYKMFHKEKMINTGKNIFHKILNHFTEILYVIS